MNVWLLREEEILPSDDGDSRLQRMGLLALELEKLGHNVVWWQSTFNHFKKEFIYDSARDLKWKEHILIKLTHSCGYPRNVCLKRIRHEYGTGRKFYSEAKKMEKPDVLVVSCPTLAFTHFAVKYSRKYHVPVVTDIRDLQPDVYESVFSGWKRRLLSAALAPVKHFFAKDIKHSTGLVGTTWPYLDWALNYAERARGKNDGVFFVSYPYSEKKTSIDEKSPWKKYVSDNGIVCSFFGQFGSMIDCEMVLNAAELCKEHGLKVTILLCGEGEHLEEYRESAKSRNLHNVIFPGWVNKNDIEDIGVISDIGLMPYRKNKNFEMQMTNKFSEYLALGQVVLVQSEGVMKSVLEENECGYFYGNEREMFEVLKKLSEDRELLDSMKKRSRKLFEEKFCVENVYRQYAKHIEKVAGETV